MTDTQVADSTGEKPGADGASKGADATTETASVASAPTPLSYQGSLAMVMRAMMAMTEHFHRRGVTVEIPRILRPDCEEPENIMIVGGQRILVRALLWNFTGQQDWPYNKGFIFVANTRATVERLGDKIGAYAAVSGDLKCAAVVRSKTREFWIDEGAYACPLEHVEWIKLMNREALGE